MYHLIDIFKTPNLEIGEKDFFFNIYLRDHDYIECTCRYCFNKYYRVVLRPINYKYRVCLQCCYFIVTKNIDRRKMLVEKWKLYMFQKTINSDIEQVGLHPNRIYQTLLGTFYESFQDKLPTHGKLIL